MPIPWTSPLKLARSLDAGGSWEELPELAAPFELAASTDWTHALTADGELVVVCWQGLEGRMSAGSEIVSSWDGGKSFRKREMPRVMPEGRALSNWLCITPDAVVHGFWWGGAFSMYGFATYTTLYPPGFRAQQDATGTVLN